MTTISPSPETANPRHRTLEAAALIVGTSVVAAVAGVQYFNANFHPAQNVSDDLGITNHHGSETPNAAAIAFSQGLEAGKVVFPNVTQAPAVHDQFAGSFYNPESHKQDK